MDEHIKPEISTYLAGALTESRNRQIEAHVASCDKCRLALSRARNKQARIKREALKKASTEKMPNFFLARQGKESAAGAFFKSSLFKKGGLLVIVLGGLYWGFYRGSAPAWVPSESTPMPDENTFPVAPTPTSAVKSPEAIKKPVAVPPLTTSPDTVKTEKPLTPAATTQLVIPKAPDVPKVPLILPVVQSIKGPESAVHENRVLVVRTLEGFQKLWADMKVLDPAPAVDFSDKVVIAIFAGPFAPGSSIEIGKIEEVGDAMVAPYRVSAAAAPLPVAGSTVTAAAPAQNYPYFLAVVPRMDRKIKISRRDTL